MSDAELTTKQHIHKVVSYAQPLSKQEVTSDQVVRSLEELSEKLGNLSKTISTRSYQRGLDLQFELRRQTKFVVCAVIFSPLLVKVAEFLLSLAQ